MPLEIARVTERERTTWSACDRAQLAKCKACKYLKVCGGLNFEDDSRFCRTYCDNDCIVYCCFDDRAVPALDALGGAEFTETWKPWEWPGGKVPDFMWVIKDGAGWMHEPAYIIPLDRLFNLEHHSWSDMLDLHKRFEIPKRSLIGITFCTKDTVVEAIWSQLDETIRRLVAYQFDFVLPINCSAYRNFPRSDALVNLKRRMVTMAKMQDAGLKVIPDVGAFWPGDRARTIDWLKKNKLPFIFCTWQTVRGTESIVRESLDWMLDIRKAVGPEVKIILAGMSMRRVKIAHEVLGNVCVMDSMAGAAGSMRVDLDYKFLRKTGMTASEVFARNRRMLEDVFYGRREPQAQGEGSKVRRAEQKLKPIEEAA